MQLWSINLKYLDTKGLLAVWREGLLAQSVLLKGEYTECPRCEGIGWGLIDKAKDNVGYNDCPKCKGKGKIKTPYYNHPALKRFKECERPLDAIGQYLLEIYAEAEVRGYKFDSSKIKGKLNPINLTVTQGQLAFEFEHLQQKLLKRCWDKAHDNEKLFEGIIKYGNIEANPLFKMIDGNVESWEKIK